MELEHDANLAVERLLGVTEDTGRLVGLDRDWLVRAIRASGHYGEIFERNLLSKAQWQSVSERALALFARGREIAARHGLILVDTKYEFGIDPQSGKITLADEIHTPDSSRYWIAETYQKKFEAGANPDSLDKEFLRLWISARCDPYKDALPEIPEELILQTAQVYIQAYETITGQTFGVNGGAVV